MGWASIRECHSTLRPDGYYREPVVKGLLLVLTCSALMIVSATSASGRSFVACVPPVGPGDALRHSVNLRVVSVPCSTGRKVALGCSRFSYGHAGICSAAGIRWRCGSTRIVGSESTETCTSDRRLVRITWTD